jgi:3',5'-nucleoside bisphosphate phosphatase
MRLDSPMLADLHLHTQASDGAWTAQEVVVAAAARGVGLMAITDHDSLDANVEALRYGEQNGVRVVRGVEVSAQWSDVSVHIVGLNLSADAPALEAALSDVRDMRRERARQIAHEFDAIGIAGTYAGALKYASADDRISRTHFARYLVAQRICSTAGEVFARFMKPGKPGYVPTEWMSIANAVALIHDAGGSAVLAHPARYDLQWHGGTNGLLRAFKDCGGDAIEVICSAHTPADWSLYAAHCRTFGFAASLGSDFHSPKESRLAIGDLPRLPASLTPVWRDWSFH